MATDRQKALAQALLGFTPGVSLTEEDKRLATATTSVIISDMVGHLQGAYRDRGAGIPVVFNDGSTAWRTPEDIIDAIDSATLAGDADAQKMFRDLLDLAQAIDPETEVALAMASSRSLRVFRIPVDDPTAHVKELLEAWG